MIEQQKGVFYLRVFYYRNMLENHLSAIVV